MTFDKITENLELEAWTAGIIYFLKRVFLNDKAKAFYNKIWQVVQLLLVLLLGWITLFLVSKSKMPSNTKLGISLAILLGMALLVYLSKTKVHEVKSVRD